MSSTRLVASTSGPSLSSARIVLTVLYATRSDVDTPNIHIPVSCQPLFIIPAILSLMRLTGTSFVPDAGMFSSSWFRIQVYSVAVNVERLIQNTSIVYNYSYIPTEFNNQRTILLVRSVPVNGRKLLTIVVDPASRTCSWWFHLGELHGTSKNLAVTKIPMLRFVESRSFKTRAPSSSGTSSPGFLATRAVRT